jgi:hypothetical protein
MPKLKNIYILNVGNPALLYQISEEKSKISLSRKHEKYSLIACNFGTIKKELPWVINC